MSSLNKYLRSGVVFILHLILSTNLFSQNLIRNSSFENYHTPINWNLWGGDFIGYYTWPPDTVMIDWGEYQTADFCVAACPHVYSGVPINHFGYNNSKDGNAYVGIGIYEKGGYGKEYIYQQLTQPLQSGKVYCLSFYVNRADRFTYAIRNIGALFSNNLPSLMNGYEINATPQVENQASIITDTANWTQIQGCFTANGGEQYITIGNFTTNYNTDTLNTNSSNLVPGRESTSYYYIDDITLTEQTTVGVNELGNESDFEIYPNPATNILNIECKLLDDKAIKITITDIIGRQVILSDYKEIDISNLEKGIYFISIYQDERLIGTKKIIKQ